jgi:hypothetical protein
MPRHNFIAEAACLFMNLDKMVGGAFEKSLRRARPDEPSGCRKHPRRL